MISQQIQKMSIKGCNLEGNAPTASRNLARFVCLLPCLTDLMIEEYIWLHDDFYHKIARLASSSKVIFKLCLMPSTSTSFEIQLSLNLAFLKMNTGLKTYK